MCALKTTPFQFEIMINFMEQHGDIHKLSNNARGRIQTIQDWENLSNLLNGDPTGVMKNTEKWKKVWSDLKNNTKRKAAKINRATTGTGGGPAYSLQLNDLEQRVLNIITPQAATGLTGVREGGFPQSQNDERTITLSPTPPMPARSPQVLEAENSPIIELTECDIWNIPGPSHRSPNFLQSNNTHIHQSVPEASQDTPTGIISPPIANRPDIEGYSPQRRRRGRATSRRMMSPRRRVRRQTQIELATQHFLRTDEDWRNFLKKKHAEECALEKEKIRLRELELQNQKKWQDVAILAIDALNKILNA